MPVFFLLWWGKLRKLAGKYPSLSIEPSAREFGGGYADACGNGKIRTHTPPPTHSLLARAVTQSAALFNPTTKRNEVRTLRPFCASRISVTYAKYAPSSSHLKERKSHPLIAFGQLIANSLYPPPQRRKTPSGVFFPMPDRNNTNRSQSNSFRRFCTAET